MVHQLKYMRKPNEDNYGIWKVRMKALLVSKDLWKAICSDLTNPATILGDGSTPGPSQTQVKRPTESSVQSTVLESDKAQKALSLIILAMEDIQLIHVDDCENGKEAWDELRKLYDEPSTANEMSLYEKFLSSKMESNASVRVHVE